MTEPTETGAGALMGNWALEATPAKRPATRTRQAIRATLRNMTVDSMAIHFLPQAQSKIPLPAAYPPARLHGFGRWRRPHFLILLTRPFRPFRPFSSSTSGAAARLRGGCLDKNQLERKLCFQFREPVSNLD